MANKKHWIQGAVKHPGVEKRAAKRAGESVHAYMESHKGSPGTAGARARLGLRFEAMAHRRRGGVSHAAMQRAHKATGHTY